MAGKGYVLMVMSGPEDGRVFELGKEQVTIGRSEGNDVVIHDDSYMRPSHALLVKRDSNFYLLSESSTDKQSTVTLPVMVGRIFTLGETEFIIKNK